MKYYTTKVKDETVVEKLITKSCTMAVYSLHSRQQQ